LDVILAPAHRHFGFLAEDRVIVQAISEEIVQKRGIRV